MKKIDCPEIYEDDLETIFGDRYNCHIVDDGIMDDEKIYIGVDNDDIYKMYEKNIYRDLDKYCKENGLEWSILILTEWYGMLMFDFTAK